MIFNKNKFLLHWFHLPSKFEILVTKRENRKSKIGSLTLICVMHFIKLRFRKICFFNYVALQRHVHNESSPHTRMHQYKYTTSSLLYLHRADISPKELQQLFAVLSKHKPYMSLSGEYYLFCDFFYNKRISFSSVHADFHSKPTHIYTRSHHSHMLWLFFIRAFTGLLLIFNIWTNEHSELVCLCNITYNSNNNSAKCMWLSWFLHIPFNFIQMMHIIQLTLNI